MGSRISKANVVGLFFSDESDDEEQHERKRSRGGWKKRPKQSYETCMFWIDHRVNLNCRDPLHVDGKEYRQNYRMSWTEDEKLINLFKKEGWLEVQDKDTMPTGQKSCPIEIKILDTLYWLGEGCTFRTIRNVAGRVLTAQSFRAFALDFCRIVATELAPVHIRMPQSVEELEIINEAYKRRGFPGACGSMDGVQLFWDACPSGARLSAKRKTRPLASTSQWTMTANSSTWGSCLQAASMTKPKCDMTNMWRSSVSGSSRT